MKNATVTVVLPAGMQGRIRDPALLRWLSRGQLSVAPRSVETLLTVTGQVNVRQPGQSLAALRYWGQRGEPPAGWLAAADPVHLETRLRDLRVRAFLPEQVSATEVQSICRDFAMTWGADSSYQFVAEGSFLYVTGEPPFATPTVCAHNAEGHVPDAFKVPGSATAVLNHLLGEVQMFLHEHPVNQQRAAAGLPAINSLWIWGAGRAPQRQVQPLPLLYADDPLFKGHWLSNSGVTRAWPGTLSACLDGLTADVVAVTPLDSPLTDNTELTDNLLALQRHLSRGHFAHVNLVFRDGLIVRIGRQHRFRVWQRRISPLLTGDGQDA